MNFYHDKQIKGYCFFLLSLSVLVLGMGLIFSVNQINAAKEMLLSQDGAIASSLFGQGVSKDVIAVAFANTETSEAGKNLLAAVGIERTMPNHMLPFISQFQYSTFYTLAAICICQILILFAGTFTFFWRRKRLYQQAEKVVNNYINGDYSLHLPQNNEGAIFQIFGLIEQLATRLQSKKRN